MMRAAIPLLVVLTIGSAIRAEDSPLKKPDLSLDPLARQLLGASDETLSLFAERNKSTEGNKIHLHAIGTTRDDAVVAINNHGVFRSEDKGETWNHFSKALRDDTFPHQIVNIGPNIIDHPDHGLLVFGNWFGKAEGPKKNDKLVVLRSRYGGESWKVDSYAVGFQQHEPATLLQDDRFLFVTRDPFSVSSCGCICDR